MKNWKALQVIAICLLVVKCTKEVSDDSDLAPEPRISFVSISPDTVGNFNNSIELKIKWADNNGDIGFDDPDETSLWVKDSRLDSADYYHVQPLSPPGHSLIVKGELIIVLNSMFILGNGSEERITLSIKLKDRANHWSNIVVSDPITIRK